MLSWKHQSRLASEMMTLTSPGLHEVFIIGSKLNCYHVLLEHFMSLTIINDFTASDFNTNI